MLRALSWVAGVLILVSIAEADTPLSRSPNSPRPFPAVRGGAPPEVIAWNVGDITSYRFVFADESGWVKSRGISESVVFYANGVVVQDYDENTTDRPVHEIDHWKLNGTDLEIYNDAGQCINYWRLMGWSEKDGNCEIGLYGLELYGATRVIRKFRIELRPPYASVVAM